MGTGSLDTVTAEANTVIAPTDWAGDTVKAARSSPDRVASSKSRRFMASSYKRELLCAIAGDGKQVGIDLVMGRRATAFTYEPRQAIDNRVGVVCSVC
jgi:hypothetical protein